MSAGRFTIQRVLGSGAHAVVCVAHDATLDRQVALKIPRLAAQRHLGILERLRDEGRILTALQHPNIACVQETLDYDGKPVLVMEYVHGVSLDELRIAQGRIDVAIAMQLIGQAATGLQYAGSGAANDGLRVVHRDVKPANVLLSDQGIIKIIDFGSAKGAFNGREAKSMFTVQGSAGFDAPERTVGEGQDSQAVDVYSLGALFLVLLTGHEPIFSRRADHHQAGLTLHLAQLVEDERIDNDDLQSLIRQMLSHNPKERPSMAMVIERLRAMLQAAGLEPDVKAFAKRHAKPNDSVRAPVDTHPLWDEVRFVTTQQGIETRPVLAAAVVARAMRKLIKTTIWEHDLTELRNILDQSERFVARPLIDVLDRTSVPWFKPWLVSARPGELEAALILLCDHADERVIHRAKTLSAHANPRVAAAARFVLAHNLSARQAHSS